MNKVDPKLLQVFADVVDQGSLTGAANIRETDTSYITRQIKKLEASLEITLLNRSTRAISLTEKGRLIYDHAKQINDSVKNVSIIATQNADQLSGSLRITSSLYLGKKFLLPILDRFCEKYPNVNIDLQLNDNQVDIIKDKFDFALRVWKPRSIDLIAQNLLDVRFMLVATPAFIQRYGTPQTLEELQRLPAIAYGRMGHNNKTVNYIDEAGNLRSFKLNANLCVNDDEQVEKYASNGSRYFLATNYMAGEKIKSGELIQLLPELQLPLEASVCVVYPNRDQTKAAQLLIEELKAVLKPYAAG